MLTDFFGGELDVPWVAQSDVCASINTDCVQSGWVQILDIHCGLWPAVIIVCPLRI